MKKLYLSLVLTFCLIFGMVSCAGMEVGMEKRMLIVGVKITTSQILKNKEGLAEKLYPILVDVENVIDKGELVSVEALDKYIKDKLNDANLSYEEQLLVNEFFGDIKIGILAYLDKNIPDITPSDKLIYAKEVVGWIKETTEFYVNVND